MAELTVLEEKIGEVIGLAMAAKVATEKVAKLPDAEEAETLLNKMNKEATETEERGTSLVDSMEGRKTAILDKARETKSKAGEMLKTYIDDDADALDGFEFLTMAEAGELGHWKVLGRLAQKAGNQQIVDLTEWAIPIQERHFSDSQNTSLELADDEDPDDVS